MRSVFRDLLYLVLPVALRLGILATTSSYVVAGETRKILSFGGNGMVGSAAVLSLQEKDPQHVYEITMVSRGSWPFDTEEVVKPLVHQIVCDRDNGIREETCPELLREIQQTDEYFAVLDFSGYLPEWIEEATKLLKGKARLYVYISSDSIYEVTQYPPEETANKGVHKSVETDAVRPVDQQLQANLNRMDEYGDQKLAGEEVLVRQRKQQGGDGIPWVALHFADVVGPRDQSSRFVTYYLWTKYLHIPGVPALHIPDQVLEYSSVTSVDDAVESIMAVLERPDGWDEAYNIASEEVFNVTEAIQILGRLQGKEEEALRIERRPAYESFSMYPSITRGPIDVSKAKGKLGFVPDTVEQVLLKALEWHDDAFFNMEGMMQSFLEDWAGNVLGINPEDDDDGEEEGDDEASAVIEQILAEVESDDGASHDEL